MCVFVCVENKVRKKGGWKLFCSRSGLALLPANLKGKPLENLKVIYVTQHTLPSSFHPHSSLSKYINKMKVGFPIYVELEKCRFLADGFCSEPFTIHCLASAWISCMRKCCNLTPKTKSMLRMYESTFWRINYSMLSEIYFWILLILTSFLLQITNDSVNVIPLQRV